MLRLLALTGFMIGVLSVPAIAQEDADDVLAEQDVVTEEVVDEEVVETKPIKPVAGNTEENYEQRLELSRKMHEIWPTRPKVEAALENVAEQIDPINRAQFKAGMRRAIKFEALQEASIDAMADIFTVEELEAMIEFYGSKEGRSVSHKTEDYERAIGPIMTQMIDKSLLDVKLGTQ
jgi:hypothetical protein